MDFRIRIRRGSPLVVEEVLDVNVVARNAVSNETRISLNVSDGGESRKIA